MTTTLSAVAHKARVPLAILHGTLMAGALDLAAAIVSNLFRGIEPLRVMQSIASGLLGPAAYEHGFRTASLGVLLHFLMMFVICAIFYTASRKLPRLVRHAVIFGALYGVAVYLFMNFVVLPLSAVPFRITYSATTLAVGLSIHVLCVGLPIALVTRSALRPR